MILVVAIDGQESANTALDYILKANYSRDTAIHLVHVIVPGFADAPVEGIPDVVAEERKEEQTILQQMATTLKDKLGAAVTTDILSGETADVIAEVCKQRDADEVIVPSHARHGFSRFWFGSVADEIADEAPCSALILKMAQNK